MFFQKKSKSEDGMHEVNMTPLIDVSLVLVVMLMLATPLAMESSIALRQAEKNARKAKQDQPKDPIRVYIMSDFQVRVNGTVVLREDLSDLLRPLLKQSTKHYVIIECKDGVSYGTFVDVLDQAKSVGANEIAVSGK